MIVVLIFKVTILKNVVYFFENLIRPFGAEIQGKTLIINAHNTDLDHNRGIRGIFYRRYN